MGCKSDVQDAGACLRKTARACWHVKGGEGIVLYVGICVKVTVMIIVRLLVLITRLLVVMYC